jgi:1,4-alpha-glucan branching enzyme
VSPSMPTPRGRATDRHPQAGASSPILTAEEVTFAIEAPGAEHVLLAGDFNDWTLDGSDMDPIGGVWTKVIKLPPGRYRYRYVVDGRWENGRRAESLWRIRLDPRHGGRRDCVVRLASTPHLRPGQAGRRPWN